MLALIGGDAGDFDQVALVRNTGRRRRQLDRVVDDAGEFDVRGAGRLAQADGAQSSPVGNLLVERAHRLGQLAVNGVDHHRRQPALNRQQQTLESGVVVNDVEAPAGHRRVDPRQVGGLPGCLRLSSEVMAPGGVGQHHNVPLRSLRAENRDFVTHSAELAVEEMDHELGPSVASRRQRVPGRRDLRDAKGDGYPAHLLPPPGASSIIPVG